MGVPILAYGKKNGYWRPGKKVNIPVESGISGGSPFFFETIFGQKNPLLFSPESGEIDLGGE
jgi:hypothetical protein